MDCSNTAFYSFLSKGISLGQRTVNIVYIEASRQFLLKIGFDREPELLDKYLLENADIILLIKD
jgi:hypothetical protein